MGYLTNLNAIILLNIITKVTIDFRTSSLACFGKQLKPRKKQMTVNDWVLTSLTDNTWWVRAILNVVCSRWNFKSMVKSSNPYIYISRGLKLSLPANSKFVLPSILYRKVYYTKPSYKITGYLTPSLDEAWSFRKLSRDLKRIFVESSKPLTLRCVWKSTSCHYFYFV